MPLTNLETTAEIVNNHLAHLKPNEQTGLTRFVDRLHRQYGSDLLRVILFGSKARGDFDLESDLDVLVVVRMTDDNYWQYWNEIVGIVWEVELAYSLVISLVIKNEHNYTVMREDQMLLARAIEQDGIELWTTQPNEPTFKPI